MGYAGYGQCFYLPHSSSRFASLCQVHLAVDIHTTRNLTDKMAPLKKMLVKGRVQASSHDHDTRYSTTTTITVGQTINSKINNKLRKP